MFFSCCVCLLLMPLFALVSSRSSESTENLRFFYWKAIFSCNPKWHKAVCFKAAFGSPLDGLMYHPHCLHCGSVPDEAWEKLKEHIFVPYVSRQLPTAEAQPELVFAQGSSDDIVTRISGAWQRADMHFTNWYRLAWEFRESLLSLYRSGFLENCDRFAIWNSGSEKLMAMAEFRSYPTINGVIATTKSLALSLFDSHQKGKARGTSHTAALLAKRLWSSTKKQLQDALRMRYRRPLQVSPWTPLGHEGLVGFNVSTAIREHWNALEAITEFDGGYTDFDFLGLLRRAHRIAILLQVFLQHLLYVYTIHDYAISAAVGWKEFCGVRAEFDRHVLCCDHVDVIVGLLHKLWPADSGRDLQVVEVGVGVGGTAQRIHAAFPHGLSYTGIDVLSPENFTNAGVCDDTYSPSGVNYPGWQTPNCGDWPRRELHRAKFLTEESTDAVSKFADKSLDIVFIDGAHGENVAMDFNAWEPKLRKGGVLVGHDFSLDYVPIVKYVLERRCRQDVHLAIGTTFWWRI